MLVLALCPLLATAAPVGKETARRAAAAFLANNGVRSNTLTDLTETAGFAHLYIFNGDADFVVMPTDDCVQPILGYSLTGTFVADAMPDNVRWWLQGYDDQIAAAVAQQSRATAAVAQQWEALRTARPDAAKTDVVVGPLVTTKWDQNYPYNYYCPEVSGGPGGHAYTGCVATAMAQLMKFWNYPATGSGSYTYTHPTYGEQTANFGATTYDWANMPNSLSSNSSQTSIDAVAVLMFHSGVSVNMNYGAQGSGAASPSVPDAMVDYFRYAPSATYVSRDAFDDDQWIAFLKNELNEHRPLFYSGNNTSSGHAFVCDGYQSDNYFHFNWGWSGSDGHGTNNGYWAIGALNPGSGGSGSGAGTYNMNNAVVAWLEPISSLLAPTLMATVEGHVVELSWEAVSGADAYDVYKDNAKVATVVELNYVDADLVFGDYPEYYVRAVEGATRSNPSNFVKVSITSHDRVPHELRASVDGNEVILSWNEVPIQSYDLHYGLGQIGGSYGTGLADGSYWGQRYPEQRITDLVGMTIDKVSIFLRYAGQYTVYLYKGIVADADHLLASKSFSGVVGWNEIELESPIILEQGNDLWVVFYTDSNIRYPCAFEYYNGPGQEEAHYMWFNFNENVFISNLPENISWPIKMHLTDGDFTFNLYRNDERIAEGLCAPTYHDTEIPVGTHAYYVKTYANGGESDASNTVNVASMATGWNWFAPMVATTMDDLEAAIGTANLEATLPSTIDDPIAPGAMVKVKTRQACAFATEAPAAAATVTIGPGLNWFGFTGSNGTPIAEVFATPAEGDKIMAQDEGFAVFEDGTWKGTLTTLRRGLGYIYFSPSRVR